MSSKSFAVIGGGAAGVFAAISAAEHSRADTITIFESGSSLLQKVKISGGGRCNVTHNCFNIETLINNYPRGKQFLKRILYQFQPQDTVAWFEKRGVKLKAEVDGRMFPITDSSQTIIDCLLHELKKHNITIHYNNRVVKAANQNNKFQITLHNKTTHEFDSLLLATGSVPIGYTIAESLGHTTTDRVPSLFTFKIKDARLENLSGVSCQKVSAKLSFTQSKFQQTGPLLVTHWGLSGPAILKLSAFAAKELYDCKYSTNLHIDFLPEYSQEDIRDLLEKSKSAFQNKQLSTINPFTIPNSLWNNIVNYSEIDITKAWLSLSKKEIHKLIEELKNAQFHISGKGIFKEEFVTCGGVSLSEVDHTSMQSKRIPNLFFAGEILDIDGITGGFNFQSAWTTGYITGKSV